MLPRPIPQTVPAPSVPDITRDDIDTLQASCRDIAAQGGEVGEIANRILRISRELDALTATADAFLSRYR